jgi:hypothetical protein
VKLRVIVDIHKHSGRGGGFVAEACYSGSRKRRAGFASDEVLGHARCVTSTGQSPTHATSKALASLADVTSRRQSAVEEVRFQGLGGTVNYYNVGRRRNRSTGASY